MVKPADLLGNRREVCYECMFTKHKTQKRKVWNDGFIVLYASRRVVLYEEPPPEGKALDEAKMNVYEWERKDEDFISVPKFFIDVINTTPIDINAKSNMTSELFSAPMNEPAPPVVAPPARTAVRPGGLSRGPSKLSTTTSKFKSPLTSTGAPPPPSVAPYRPSHLAKRTASGMRKDTSAAVDQFDFGRNPTSEWNYVPNAIKRAPDEIAAIWFGEELFE